MKTMKKTLSLFLALCLVLSFAPLSALADETATAALSPSMAERSLPPAEKAHASAAAKDYCTAAQIYFKYHADGLKVSDAVYEVTADTLSGYIAGRDGELPAGVSIEGISAMLESDNTLRLYYGFKDVDPSKFSFAIDGDEAGLKQRSDGMYYLALDKGVYSNRLQDTHTYTISDGTDAGTCTITASVLSYARSCVNRSDEKEVNLGKALYLYNQAAIAVFGR